MMEQAFGKLQGLTSAEAAARQARYGKNELAPPKKTSFAAKIIKVIGEPMFLLLIGAAAIYFLLGEPRDGVIMLVFVLGIIGIEAIQEWKTDRTLAALRDLSNPSIKVLRDGRETMIDSRDLVPGDVMLLSEGVKIPADGLILQACAFCVDESMLSGESLGVWKRPRQDGGKDGDAAWRRDSCYAGTLVLQGTAAVRVTKIDGATEYGKIGRDIAAAPCAKTPLQKQTGRLVKWAALLAAALFLLVAFITYLNIAGQPLADRISQSILAGITIAMAMIPEEFPVILTVFLSLGAWRLAQKNSLIRRLPAVETLGAVSVLCVDKTGTVTENNMAVQQTYAARGDAQHLLRIMGMACQSAAYDPMEQAMLSYCDAHGLSGEALFGGGPPREYPFSDETKIMGRAWLLGQGWLLAAKGAPEHLLPLCDLPPGELAEAERQLSAMSGQGLRVIAVAQAALAEAARLPRQLDQCRLEFLGLIGLADPPRDSIKADIAVCRQAGVRLVMITGDSGITASAIARQIGITGGDQPIGGQELDAMSDEQLQRRAGKATIFCRMLPRHKLRIIRALQANGEVVAMTGDGVNDAPALKYADIGIAMGGRGSQVAREAADLILLDDNFSTIVDTIKDGRRIYDNIRKAVAYVVAIHIPIACASLLAPLLGISTSGLLLLPLHVVLLELVIDPTCSIIFERQPVEPDIMRRPPRPRAARLLQPVALLKSILQGLAIFAAAFALYYAYLNHYPQSPLLARSMGLSVIFLANLLLIQVNSSEHQLAVKTLRQQWRDKALWGISLGTIAGLGLMLYTPLGAFLQLAPLSGNQLLLAAAAACAAVLWIEPLKASRNLRRKRQESGGGKSASCRRRQGRLK